jgi:hypothetical protein
MNPVDRSPRVTVVLPDDIRAAVEREAQRERTTMSHVVRSLVVSWAREQPVQEAAA